jgi:diguanylate cyclase (GGDEF)-like protein/PAS domain S-box-containing protein
MSTHKKLGGAGVHNVGKAQASIPAMDAGQIAFCTAMDAIADAIFLIDRTSMRIVHVNDAACRLQNQTRAEVLAQSPWELLSISRADLEITYDALIAGKADTTHVELLRQRKDSSPIWVEMRRHARRSGEGWLIVSQVRDITERKQSEATLLASETRFRNVFEKAYTGMAIADLDGKLLEANDALAQLLGYPRRELIGRNIADFTHADDLALERIYLKEIQTGQRSDYRMNKRYLTCSGELLWVDLLVTSIPDEKGTGINAIGLMVDISERKRAEAELRVAAVAFQSLEAMMVTDPSGVILRVNRAFTEITGYSAEEAVGHTPLLLQSGRHSTDFYREMWETIDRTGGWRGEIWDRRKNGEIYPKWLTLSAVKGEDGAVTHYIGTHTDISERKKTDEKIKELAFFDQLTGLPNRTLLLDRLKQAMATSSRDGSYGALLFIDLDNFKTLNDTQGHNAGDQLLRLVAQRLSLSLREGDTVARLGGDEFVAILKGLGTNSKEAATGTQAAAVKLLHTLAETYLIDAASHHSTASIGATLFHGNRITIDELMKQADLSMYKSKAAGRNTVHFFDPLMEVELKARSTMEADMRLALKEEQFLLHYQAQVVDSGRLVGAEVLVRWQHPQRGLVSPAEFIPLAEETRLILSLGNWVLETACAQLALWAKQPDMAHLTLAVNISAHQFHQPDFVQKVLAILHETRANPQRLKLELTESLLVRNVEEIIEKMFALKAKGVGFSLDDFGTGYSSLTYLKRLPLDQLKIDQSFVRDVLIDPNDAAIAKTIVALANTLGLGVIAEGVETAAQRDFLADSGCYAYQGYFFSRPLPIEDFVAFARQG